MPVNYKYKLSQDSPQRINMEQVHTLGTHLFFMHNNKVVDGLLIRYSVYGKARAVETGMETPATAIDTENIEYFVLLSNGEIQKVLTDVYTSKSALLSSL
jgi:multimeric flavodoxin WrbA